MTSLLPRPALASPSTSRRPLTAVAALGGVFAAGSTLFICACLGVIGWFATDLGAHGTPRSGLKYGAVGWLMAHGSGVHVGSAAVTAVPLGVTLVCIWTTWRVALRVGELVSGHGPDADAISDGERDWTVPVATGLFIAGYVLVAVTTAVGVGADLDLSSGRVVWWSILIGGLVGGPGLAIGSGRAAIWTAAVPAVVRDSARVAVGLVVGWLTVSALMLLAAFVVDFRTAANITSQLHAGGGDLVVLALGTLLVVPNAVLFSSAYLAGPGFAIGTGTLVAPAGVVLGPLPMFPLLAALPDNGTPPAWVAGLIGLPAVVAVICGWRSQRRSLDLGWTEAGVRGLAGGVVAAVVLALLSALAGGAVGPGRMRDVAPFAGDVFAHLVVSFALGGLVGALAAAGWQRRT